MTDTLTPRSYGAVNWIGLQTLYIKEVRRFFKVSVQTVFGPVISTWLLMVVFVIAFGADKRVLDGIPFPDFLAPGLVMLSILSNAFQNSSSSLTISKVQGTIVDLLMPPLSSAELTASFLAGAATRGLVCGAATAVAIMMFANVNPVHWGATLYFAIVASLMFGAIGVLGGVWAEKFDNLAAITTFIITPLTFLSGTFYSIKVLPEPFHTIIQFNPVFHLIDGFRYGFTGHADTSVLISAVSTGLLTMVLIVACWAVFVRGWRLKA